MMNSDCNTNVLSKLADKTPLFHLQNDVNRSAGTIRQIKDIQYANHFPENLLGPSSSSSFALQNNVIVGSTLQDIPLDQSQWGDEFLYEQTSFSNGGVPNLTQLSSQPPTNQQQHLEINSMRFGDNNVSAASALRPAAPRNYTTSTTTNLKYQTYDYYNIEDELQQQQKQMQMEPRSMTYPSGALQDEFDELEKELADLDLDSVMTTTTPESLQNNLLNERQLFRETATELYTLTSDCAGSFSQEAQSKIVNSKFMNMMKLISSGSVNLNNTQTELCSMTTNEPMGNKYINISENIYN